MSEHWEEHEAAPNGKRYLGFVGSESDPVLLAPANEHADGVYGLYFDSNPAFVFDRERLVEVLTMTPDDALVSLRLDVPDDQISWGAPLYVRPRTAR